MVILTALDLEMNMPSGKIIQIGACKGNIETGEVISSFSCFVDPQELLEPFIIKLTGITQKDVIGAPDIYTAYCKLKEYHQGSFCNPITWGGGDVEAIRSQSLSHFNAQQLENPVWGWPFGRRWIDAKTLYVSYRLSQGKVPAGGLAKAMTKFGLKFEGRKHNAEDDAKNTFRIYHHMLKLFTEPKIFVPAGSNITLMNIGG